MNDKKPFDKVKNKSRRKLIKSLGVAGGVLAASSMLPRKWTRPVVESVVLPAHAQATGVPLSISPPTATVVGYSGTNVTFTASGGVPPYSWSNTGYGGSLNVLTGPQVVWDEGYDYCDETGTATVTVMDSTSATATAIISIPTEDC